MILVPRSHLQKWLFHDESLDFQSSLKDLEVFYGSENIQIKPKLWIEHQKH